MLGAKSSPGCTGSRRRLEFAQCPESPKWLLSGSSPSTPGFNALERGREGLQAGLDTGTKAGIDETDEPSMTEMDPARSDMPGRLPSSLELEGRILRNTGWVALGHGAGSWRHC